MTVEFEALCDMAGEDAEATEIVREAICDTKKTIIERLKNKEKQNDTEKGTQKEMETSVEIAISQDTTVNPLTDSGTLQGEANFNILNTPCSTNQSTTNCIKDPPIKKKRGRPQTTCYLPSGQKGRHKDSQAAPTVSGKGKGKLKNNNGKAKPKANEQGASYFQSDGPPSKLKVTRASKSVSFSNQQEDMCTGTDSDDFLCRSNLFYEDTLQCQSTIPPSVAETMQVLIFYPQAYLKREGYPFYWPVTASYVNHVFSLTIGWADFVADNSLQEGDMLFMSFRNSLFTFSVHDTNTGHKNVLQAQNVIHHENPELDANGRAVALVEASATPATKIILSRFYVNSKFLNIPKELGEVVFGDKCSKTKVIFCVGY